MVARREEQSLADAPSALSLPRRMNLSRHSSAGGAKPRITHEKIPCIFRLFQDRLPEPGDQRPPNPLTAFFSVILAWSFF
ncbi:Hypothetical protein Minf_2104 [Methylacidiphilum infernorum V4]|uniref:Uncharacterized protein n=1 Tax=Methylacidiphilum infernorum (isolate V4) TaxID=481448 RepID=B3DZ66_METI4|nr:Hypothetical protein Minf_2104 [Methylacidiphilum infernorum V4]